MTKPYKMGVDCGFGIYSPLELLWSAQRQTRSSTSTRDSDDADRGDGDSVVCVKVESEDDSCSYRGANGMTYEQK